MVTLKLKFTPSDEVSINEDAFDGKLISSKIGKTQATYKFESLTHIGSNAINGSIVTAEVPESVTRIEADAFQSILKKITAACINDDYFEIIDGELVACFYKGSEAIEITVPEGVTVIGKNAFKDVRVKKLTLPKTVKRLEARAVSTNALTSIKLNKGLEEMGEECLHFTNLKTLTIPDTVTTIGDRAFSKCWELTKIKIGQGVTYIGDSILFDSHNLKEINGKYATDDKLALIFEGRLIAYAVKTPQESYSIPEGVKVIGRGAFWRAQNLKEMFIPDYICDIEPQAFSLTKISRFTGKFTTADNRCVIVGNRFIAYHYHEAGDPHETLTIPECVTEICDDACRGLTGLDSVEWHDGITTIGERAFMNNWHLRLTPALPASLEVVGKSAFENMRSYSDLAYFPDGVVVPPSVRYIGRIGLYTYMFWFSSENPPVWEYWKMLFVKAIFVPEHLIEKYKEAYPWYADKIEEWEC